jgi:putative isomerase
MLDDYAKAIGEYLLKKCNRVLKEPQGVLKHPFIDPGEGYGGNLWDWDSYWTAYALIQAFDTFDEKTLNEADLTRGKAFTYGKGCVQNFLDQQCADGFTPIVITATGLFSDFFVKEHEKGTPSNQMKPFLCQFAANLCEFANDYTWVELDKLIAYLSYYEQHQQDKETGLFFWENDVMIGVDNNPTVYFRPDRSCADIYLNSFLYG